MVSDIGTVFEHSNTPHQNAEHRSDSLSAEIDALTDSFMTYVSEQLSRANDTSKMLVIHIGELHNAPNHAIAQANIIRTLAEENIPFAFAMERETNKVESYLSRRSNLKDIRTSLSKLTSVHDHYDLRKRILIDDREPRCCPLSVQIQLDLLEKHAIPYFAIDCARITHEGRRNPDTRYTLKSSDQATRAVLRQADTTLSQTAGAWPAVEKSIIQLYDNQVSATSVRGMLARNIHMQKACDILSENLKGVKILLLTGGAAHVFGNNTSDPNFSTEEHSLAFLSQRARHYTYKGFTLSERWDNPSARLEEQCMEMPKLSKSLLADTEDGASALQAITPEAERIQEFNLPWLEPYKPHLHRKYLENVKSTRERILMLENLEM